MFMMHTTVTNLKPIPKDLAIDLDDYHQELCTRSFCHDLFYRHSLVVLPIKPRNDTIFGQKPATHHGKLDLA